MPLSSIDMHKILHKENNKCATFVLELECANTIMIQKLSLWPGKTETNENEMQTAKEILLN